MLYSRNTLYSPFAIKDKIFDIDFILFFSVLLLGIISIFAQYSSSGGVWESQAVNHAIRFLVFFNSKLFAFEFERTKSFNFISELFASSSSSVNSPK